MSDSPVFLELDNLSIQYDNMPVLRSASLQLGRSQLCVLVGLSGSGKTSILRTICRLNVNFTGQVRVYDDTQPAMVFQDPRLFSWLSVEDNIAVCTRAKSDLILHWLRKFGLEEYRKHKPHQISGGMRQKVALIRALLFNSKFILMDEPFSALDLPQREYFQDLLLEIWKEQGSTILYVTHDIDEALYLGQTVYALRKSSKNLSEPFENKEGLGKDRTLTRATSEYQDRYERIYQLLKSDWQRENG